jgi:Flp pilus assembly pilin Flp
MTQNHKRPGICQREPTSRLLSDETGVTTLEYVVAAVALALGAVAASRAISGVLIDYLRRIYLVVTLPMLCPPGHAFIGAVSGQFQRAQPADQAAWCLVSDRNLQTNAGPPCPLICNPQRCGNPGR